MALSSRMRKGTTSLFPAAICSETHTSALSLGRCSTPSVWGRGAYARGNFLKSAESRSRLLVTSRAYARTMSHLHDDSDNSSRYTSRPLLLTFDAFDTLFTPKDTVFDQYSQVAARHGIDARPADIGIDFRQAYKQTSANHPNYGKATGVSPETWWTLIMDASFPASRYPGLSDGTRKAIAEELYERFSSSLGYRLFPDVIPFLKLVNDPNSTWSPPQTMLGVISNSDPRIRGILDSFDIPTRPALYPKNDNKLQHAHMSFATLSYEAGAEKPEPSIFQQALRDAQTTLTHLIQECKLGPDDEPRESRDPAEHFDHVHVGDDLSKDALAAVRAGWQGIWLDRSSDEHARKVLVDADGTVIADPATLSDFESARKGDAICVTTINSLAALPNVIT